MQGQNKQSNYIQVLANDTYLSMFSFYTGTPAQLERQKKILRLTPAPRNQTWDLMVTRSTLSHNHGHHTIKSIITV